MAEISKITLPSGNTYDIKDATARASIESIESAIAGGMVVVGETTTNLSDGSTTATITINGESYTAKKGDLVWHNSTEFLFDGTKWIEVGDLSSIGALGYKDSASGSYTPAGTVSQPTFSGSELTATGTFTPTGSVTIEVGSGTTNYTPAGSVSKPDITVTPVTDNVYSITDVGTLPELTATVINENLTLGFSRGTLPTKGAAQAVMTSASANLDSAPTFSGTGVEIEASFTGSQGNISVAGTPAGTVTQPTFSGTTSVITVS